MQFTVSARGVCFVLQALIAIKMAPKKLENNFLVSTLGKLLLFLVNYSYYATFFVMKK
jgi:hypothetical protein